MTIFGLRIMLYIVIYKYCRNKKEGKSIEIKRHKKTMALM